MRVTELLALCLLGAIAGWTAGLAESEPAAPPAGALLAFGAITAFGGGYLAGTTLRGRRPRALSVRAAAVAALVAVTAKAKATVPALATWTAVLVASGVFGVAGGFARPRGAQ